MLVDYNVNGAFNDKSADFGQCDRVRIGEKGSQDSRYVGNYVEVDNKLYKPEIAKDGAFIILTEAADVSYGTVRISKDVSSFSVGGMNGLFNRKPENGVVKLPVGDYRIVSWSLIKNDDKGVKWELRGSSYRGGPGGFTVKSGEEKSLAVGEPVYSKAQYQKSGTSYMFNQNLEGGQGEQIELLRNGAQPPPPKLRIRSRDGTYDRALSFEYG
ncbi:MAG: hypothetical protein A2Y77_14005 [Planctomycetes bacterium RBG_13_62_9]|nr:MAG: hypothetical protein A2Y77_14005 [Planctomycetes bacterium RBG_13_62_9]